jgi:hypothetical protein
MTTSPKVEPLVPDEAFARIFARIKIPEEDSYLREWWRLLCSINPSKFHEIREQVKQNLEPMLKADCEFCEDPFVCLFLAHWYNLGHLAGQGHQAVVEQTLMDAIRSFKGKLNDYGEPFNRYNQAIAYWYQGLHKFFDPECDRSAYRTPMLQALSIIDDLLNEYEGIKPRDGFYSELIEISRELMLWSERPCPNKSEKPSTRSSPPDFRDWLDRHGLKK